MALARCTPSPRALFAFTAALSIALAGVTTPAHALRFVTWNVLDYDFSGVRNTVTPRQADFRIVMTALQPDLVVLQELKSTAARDSFLINVLNVIEPGQWSSGDFLVAVPPVESCIFYKSAKLIVGPAISINIGPTRQALRSTVRPVGYASTTTIRIYSVHLKAGSAAGDYSQRGTEATNLRTSINTLASGSSFLVAGDYNLQGAHEDCYIKLTESTGDNDGQCKDPLNMPGIWHNLAAYSCFYTQCPCVSCPSIPGVSFSGGGMDDRFDLWLTSNSMQDGQGYELIPATYTAYGNDCNHFNQDINAGTNSAVGPVIATALHNTSDHLPIVIDVQIPAKLVTASAIDFGSLIAGTAAAQMLTISNVATPPADALDYSFAPPTDFGAPAGSFNLVAGGTPVNHTITMDTATPGLKSGTLLVNSDYPDTIAKPVLLSGRVLRHASASLDSAAVLTSANLEWGAHLPGTFSDQAVRVHNQAYDALQARLSVDQGLITGGDGRFSFVAGFTSALLAGVGRSYNLHFEDTGATLDSAYTATLTFQSADEVLPGSGPASDLVVHLRAIPVSTITGIEPTPPRSLRFYAPRPNPVSRSTEFRFDLPKPAPVSLEIFDLSGRRVARLVSGTLDASRHVARWDATDETGGRVSGGLYFARFQTPGFSRTERIAVLP